MRSTGTAKRVLATIAITVTAASLVAVPSTAATVPARTAAAPYRPPPIAWGSCEGLLPDFGQQCGSLVVPLDYARPKGATISLAVSRLRHRVPDSQFQGIMLANPGGPGGSGLILSVLGLGDFIPTDGDLAYDWIGFDPRGVGASEPSLTCDPSYFDPPRPQYVPITSELERTWLARSRGYARDCDADGGRLLDHLTTVDTVRDMDSLRQALGEARISLYGFSYGTYLGQVYSTLYPDRVRRMVWDGVVDPTRVWYRSNLDQDVAFDKSADIYFRWLADHDDVFALGADYRRVKLAYYEQYARLSVRPVGTLGPDELNDVVLNAAYYVYNWVEIGTALSALANDRDPAPLEELYAAFVGPGDDNAYAMYLATVCTDARWPASWARVRNDNWRTFAKAPFATWNNGWFNGPCNFWRGDVGRTVRVDGSAAPPILMISETYDAATPFSGALQVRRQFPRSVLIEGVGGSTHAGSLSGVTCTDDLIGTYLATGRLPARLPGNRADVACPPVPPPDPAAAAAARVLPGELSQLLRDARQQAAAR